MALAVPLRMSMPATNKMDHMDVRSRQRQPFDAELLCSKLEAHKRELEQSRLRKEKRDAQQNPMFVPQTAAKQFAATATPMKDLNQSRSVRLSTQPAIAADHRRSLNPKQLYAALNVGMSESEAVAAICHANEPWRKASPAPARIPGTASARQPQEVKSRERSPRSNQTRQAPGAPGTEEARPISFYRPGDAEKRRVEEVKISFRDVAYGSREDGHMSWHAAHIVPSHRHARDKEEEMPYDLRLMEGDETASGAKLRPKLMQRNRANWSQLSQSGDDMRHTLHWARLHSKPKAESRANQADDDFVPRSMSDCTDVPPAVSQERRASENMIADAVKIIKKEEKVRRRESVMAFLKKVL